MIGGSPFHRFKRFSLLEPLLNLLCLFRVLAFDLFEVLNTGPAHQN